jgi:hypothetical protein
MGEACGSHGREIKRIEVFGKEIRGKEYTQRSPSLRRVGSIKIDHKQSRSLELDGCHFSADKKKYRAVVNSVM